MCEVHKSSCPEQQVVDPYYARTAEYAAILQQIIADGKCPFCPEHFKYHEGEVIKENVHWYVINNMRPYENTDKHILVICKRHCVHFNELKDAEILTWRLLINELIHEFNILGGGMALRFGETRYTGATVCHLHFHLIVPKLGEDGRAIPVFFPVG